MLIASPVDRVLGLHQFEKTVEGESSQNEEEGDHTKRLFNGYASSEAYTKYLLELFGKSNTSNLDNPVYANSIRIKL